MSYSVKNMNDVDIAAYLDSGLSTSERDAFEVLLRGSPVLRESIALIEQVRQNGDDHGDAPESLKRRVIDLYPVQTDILDLVVSVAKGVMTVVQSSADVLLTPHPQFAAVRRQDQQGPSLVKLSRQFENTSVDVHVEHVGHSACSFTVQARDVAANRPLERARVDLLDGHRQLASNPLENGTALFEDVQPGKYALKFWKNNGVLGIMTVKIVCA